MTNRRRRASPVSLARILREEPGHGLRDVLRQYARQQPFRPFRIHLASGRTYDIRHPEIVLGGTVAVIFSAVDTDTWDTASLMLMESVNHLDVPVA